MGKDDKPKSTPGLVEAIGVDVNVVKEAQPERAQTRPVCHSLCTVLRRNSNVKCLILTFLIDGCLVAIVWCRNTQVTKILMDFDAFPITRTRQVSPCDDGVVYIPTAFVIMLYLLYLVECWHCKARITLSLPKTGINTVYRQIQEMREAQPIIWWKAICYHYTRRVRQVTRYKNGASLTSSQVFYERVNSHAMASYFFYTLCGMKDVSPEVTDLEKYPITKIKFSKGFNFANDHSAAEFEEQRSTFFQEQGGLDDYMEMRESLELSNSNVKESMTAWASPECLPWFAKNNIFWLFSFLLLSWPIRILLELNTAHLNYRVTKLFGINYPSNSSMDRPPCHRPLPFSANYFTSERHRRHVPISRVMSTSPEIVSVPPRCFSGTTLSNSNLNFEEQMTWRRKKRQVPFTSTARTGLMWSSLPRSVTWICTPAKDFLQKTNLQILQGKNTKSSRIYLDEDECLIPTYSEALLLLDGTRPFVENSNVEESRDNDGESGELRFNLPSSDVDASVNSQAPPAEPPSPSIRFDTHQSPPTYLEALRTSKPVFLPPFASLRRCLTERDLTGRVRGHGQRSSDFSTTWFGTTSSYFVQTFSRARLPLIFSTGGSQVTSSDLWKKEEESQV